MIHCWNVETVPCNWLQCYENTADEVHVAFVHRPGGSHAKLAADLPVISAEETDWGMLRFGTRAAADRCGKRCTTCRTPTRVIVPPLAGFDGVGGWQEIYFSFTPIDDENHLWLITSHVKVTGAEAEQFLAKKAEFLQKVRRAPKVMDLVQDVWAGRRRLVDIDHPELAMVQDIAVQAGQGRIADRDEGAPRALGCGHHPLAQAPRARARRDRRGPADEEVALITAGSRADARRLAKTKKGASRRPEKK